MLNKVIRTVMFVLTAALVVQTSVAQAKPKAWMHAGEIDEIDYDRQKMLVGDLPFSYTFTSRLTAQGGKKSIPAHALSAGDTVGVDYTEEPGKGRIITDLQRFRPGTKPRLDNED